MNANKASRNSDIVIQSDWEASLFAIRITIKDFGIGLSPNQQLELFEPLASKSSGVGLSLSISKGILNCLGTEIWLDKSSTDKKDHGSVFQFRIPVVSYDGEQPVISTKQKPVLLSAKRKIRPIVVRKMEDFNFEDTLSHNSKKSNSS